MRNITTIGVALGIGWVATGCQVDMNVGDWITPDKYAGDLNHGNGNGNGSSGSGGSESTSPTGDPPLVTACIDEEQGGPTSCKDAGTWKHYASQACEGAGLLLTDYATQEECGKGLFRYVSYTCCPPAEPPPPSNCVDEKQGGPTSCKDAVTWKKYAWEACESSGLILNRYATQEECGNGLFRYVSYTCCPPVEPPPPPPNCVDEEQGGPTSCKDAGTWKQYAAQACESNGLLLSDYETREECGKGLFRYVSYTCCPPAPPPPTCVDEEQGGPTSCKDAGTWKQYAAQACESNGLLLSDYETREECGKGLSRYVSYTCCSR